MASLDASGCAEHVALRGKIFASLDARMNDSLDDTTRPRVQNLGGGYYKGSGTRGPVRAGGKREAFYNFVDGKGAFWDFVNTLIAVVAVILLVGVPAFGWLVYKIFSWFTDYEDPILENVVMAYS